MLAVDLPVAAEPAGAEDALEILVVQDVTGEKDPLGERVHRLPQQPLARLARRW
jgi:hypothetical protein